MAENDLFKKKTIWNLTTKEMRIKLKAMPGMNANIFKKWFDWYHREIINAMTDEQAADNVKKQLADQFAMKLCYNYISGWNQNKYAGLVDGNYLYNRCHLIGYQLTGENANTKNLITGTRYLNIEGMLPFENQIAEYVKETQNHVLYR